MTDQGYRGPQVCKIVGITYRQLDYWARTDLVRPSVMDANGSGTQRLYSFRDLVELKVIKQMLDAGIALQSARKAVESLRSFNEDLASVRIVIDRVASVVLAESDEQVMDLMRGGQGVLSIVPLAPVHDNDQRSSAALVRHDARRAPRRDRSVVPSTATSAPARARALRAQLRAAVREAARLLRHRVGVRAAHVHARVRTATASRRRRSRPTSTCRRTTSTSRSRRSTRSS